MITNPMLNMSLLERCAWTFIHGTPTVNVEISQWATRWRRVNMIKGVLFFFFFSRKEIQLFSSILIISICIKKSSVVWYLQRQIICNLLSFSTICGSYVEIIKTKQIQQNFMVKNINNVVLLSHGLNKMFLLFHSWVN